MTGPEGLVTNSGRKGPRDCTDIELNYKCTCTSSYGKIHESVRSNAKITIYNHIFNILRESHAIIIRVVTR